MPVTAILALAVALLLMAGLAVRLASDRHASRIIYGACLAVSTLLLLLALGALIGGWTGSAIVLPLGIPWLGAHFRLDALSAFFLCVINLGGAGASLFALGNATDEEEPGRVLPFYAAFLGAMNLVVIADDAFSFLLAWETMSLASWALVVAHHHVPDNLRAGQIYLAMASFGTLMLLLAFGILAGPDGNYAFSVIQGRAPSAATAGVVLVLALLGAGSKAGLVPLHVWLPLAHPAAPSHVSALMSGVMTKIAVYAFVRIVFDLAGPPAWWWAIVVLPVAGLCAVIGVLQALMQHDLKRLLAFSTVENVGVIFIGLGLALAFQASGIGWAAALAFTAALLHVLNHSLFKSLLFFGAGAVLKATGERNIERLGGLIHLMPQTALLFLVGSLAASALPPLNGFASEWLMFQAILVSPQLPSWALRFLVPAIGALLAMSAAFGAACFVRAFGITFLGRARSEAVARATEADRLSIYAMAGLAGLCLLAGILPGLLIDLLGSVTNEIIGTRMPVQTPLPLLAIVPINSSRSSYAGLLLFVLVTLAAMSTAWLIHRFASRRIRRGPAWDCGYPDASPATQYSGMSFAQPILRVFGPAALGSTQKVTMPAPGASAPARLVVQIRDLAWDYFYVPLIEAVTAIAIRLNGFQALTIRRYLGLVFLSLVGLLSMLAIWQ